MRGCITLTLTLKSECVASEGGSNSEIFGDFERFFIQLHHLSPLKPNGHCAYVIGVLSGSRAVFINVRPPDTLIHMVASHAADKSVKDSCVSMARTSMILVTIV